MKSLSMTALVSAKQEQLPRTLTKIVMQRKYGYIYNFFMCLKELSVNKVPIFTRLKSYQALVNRKGDEWGQDDSIYADRGAVEYKIRQKALTLFGKVFRTLNAKGLKLKAAGFAQWRHNVCELLDRHRKQLQFAEEFQPSKEQRKSLGLILKNSK